MTQPEPFYDLEPPDEVLPVENLPWGPLNGDAQPYAGAGLLFGWSFQEMSGVNDGAVELHDGTTVVEPLIVPVTLLPNESTRDWFGPNAIRIRAGLFVHVSASTVRGTLWFLPHAPGRYWRDEITELFG